jgi:hypothetical protein
MAECIVRRTKENGSTIKTERRNKVLYIYASKSNPEGDPGVSQDRGRQSLWSSKRRGVNPQRANMLAECLADKGLGVGKLG